MAIDALAIFDLDDTLIDTKGVLLPPALDAVARAIGVPVERLNPRGKKLDEVLDRLDGLSSAQRAAAADAWYDPAVPPFAPLAGAAEMIAALRGRIHLALLTRGDPARQRNKIEMFGLGHEFDAIRIRAIEEPGSKADDLRAFLEQFGVSPERAVVIGDDPLDELRHGRALGCPVLLVPDVSLDEIPARLDRMGLLATGC